MKCMIITVSILLLTISLQAQKPVKKNNISQPVKVEKKYKHHVKFVVFYPNHPDTLIVKSNKILRVGITNHGINYVVADPEHCFQAIESVFETTAPIKVLYID